MVGAAAGRAPRTPFPGLRSFSQDESELFFGREGQSDELARKLGQSRFVAVVGTSGSGKSSLVRAGLMPSLEGGCLVKAGSNWRIVDMRPGSRPIENLAAALDVARISEAGVDPGLLRSSSLALLDLARQAYEGQRLGSDENLLILVDQFEELFRYKASSMDDRDEKAAFVKLLLEVTKQREFPVYVVITMRSDFLGDCARFRDLPENINAGQYLIPRMTRDQRREAIEGPVHMAGSAIASRLVQRILNDVGEDPDQLPVMQHALMRTWYHWRSRNRADLPVDIEDYEAIGTLENALSSHADKAYAQACAKVPGRGDRIVKRIFQRLRERDASGRETRRPTPLRELCEVSEASQEDVLAVLECFRREGRSFLMPPTSVDLAGEREVDITHESLLRQWKRLQGPPSEDSGWLAEEEESRRTMVRLADRAEQQVPGKPDYLRAPLLQVALDWWNKRKPTEAWAERYTPSFRIADEFLHESEKNEKRELEQAAQREKEAELARVEQAELRAKQVKVRRALIIGALVGLIITGLAVKAFRESAEAKRQAQEAQKQKGIAEQKAKEAETQKGIAEDQRGIAEQQTNEAQKQEKLAEDETARANEQEKLARAASIEANKQKEIADRLRKEAVGQRDEADSIRLASNALDVIDSEDPQRGPEHGALLALEASKRMFTPEAEDALHKAIKAGRLQRKMQILAGSLGAFSMDRRYYAAGNQSGSVSIYDLWSDKSDKPDKPVATIRHPGQLYALGLSPDGTYLATAGADKGVHLWSVHDGKGVDRIGNPVSPDEKPVHIIAFSSQGKYLATGSDDAIRVWEVSDSRKKPVELPMDPGEKVHAIVFNPTIEEQLAVSSGGGEKQTGVVERNKASVWMVTGKQPEALKWLPAAEASDDPISIVFSPNGKRLSTFTSAHAKVWDVTSDAVRLKASINSPARFGAFSPDGRELAISDLGLNCKSLGISDHEDRVSVLDADTGGCLFTLPGSSTGYDRLAFSPDPDGTRLATAGSGVIRIWTAVPGNEQVSPSGVPAGINRVAFSPDGSLIAAASSDSTVIIWNSRTGKLTTTLPGDNVKAVVNDIAFSLDGTRLASASSDGTVMVWDPSSGKRKLPHPIVHTASGKAVGVTGVAFSSDGKKLATVCRDNTAKLWDAETGDPVTGDPLVPLTGGNDDRFQSVAFSPDGKYLAAGSLKGTINLWDAKERKFLKPLRGHHSPVWDLEFSRDSSRLASASADGTAKVWNLPSGDESRTLSGHKRGVLAVAFSPDGKRLATGSFDQTVKIWDASTGYELFTLFGHASAVNGVAFSSDGRLVTAGADRNVLVYAVDTETLKRLAERSSEKATGLDISEKATGLDITECKKYHLLDKSFDKRPPSEQEDTQKKHCYAAELVQEGEEHIKAEQIPDAVADFQKAKKYDPGIDMSAAVQALVREGDNLAKADKIDDAVKVFKNAQELDPGLKIDPQARANKPRVDALLQEGDNLAKAGETDDAVKMFKDAQGLDPSLKIDPQARANKPRAAALLQEGDNLAKAGKMQEAAKAFSGAQELDPSLKIDPARANKARATALLPEGDKLAKAGKIDDAIKVFKDAQGLDPSLKIDPQARANKARAAALLPEGDKLARQGNVQEAVKVFSGAQELDPSLKIDPQARANSLAAVATVQNALDALQKGTVQVKQAVAEFSRAERLDSKSITAVNWNDLCWYGSLLDDARDVLSACERAVSEQPNTWQLLDSRGLALALLGKSTAAIADFERVVDSPASEAVKTQRASWIRALKGGQNPFTPTVMNDLRKESGVVNPAK